jgi:hypothetical protein
MDESPTWVLHIEHPVPDYEAWKRDAFDRDPVGREANGVRRYRVLRTGATPTTVAVELEFDDRQAATAFQARLTDLWRGTGDRFEWRELPEARIFELAAAEGYADL